jgi:hypothetical protein
MRIISNFHDYYDGCLAYGIDPKCLYIREEVELKKADYPRGAELKSPLYASRPGSWFSSNGYTTGCVWFCGKAFPYVVYTYALNHYETAKIYCYDFDQLSSALLMHGDKEEKKWFELPAKKRHATKEAFRKFFEDNKYVEKEVTNALCKLGAPVLAWTRSAYYIGNEDAKFKNPMLKKLQFFKVKDSFAAFQELSMFISGVMGGSAPPMIQISDEVRKEKHGFDEWSFRKKVR